MCVSRQGRRIRCVDDEASPHRGSKHVAFGTAYRVASASKTLVSSYCGVVPIVGPLTCAETDAMPQVNALIVLFVSLPYSLPSANQGYLEVDALKKDKSSKFRNWTPLYR